MKYTSAKFAVVAMLLATFGLSARTQGQAYAAATPSLGALNATPIATSAVTSSDDPQGGMITLHARVNEVNVLFIATDKHGKFVRDLNQNDFNILDDHKPPQAILNFRRETDLPLHVGMLIDVSGSVNSRFDFEQTAATAFLQHTLRA